MDNQGGGGRNGSERLLVCVQGMGETMLYGVMRTDEYRDPSSPTPLRLRATCSRARRPWPLSFAGPAQTNNILERTARRDFRETVN